MVQLWLAKLEVESSRNKTNMLLFFLSKLNEQRNCNHVREQHKLWF